MFWNSGFIHEHLFYLNKNYIILEKCFHSEKENQELGALTKMSILTKYNISN